MEYLRQLNKELQTSLEQNQLNRDEKKMLKLLEREYLNDTGKSNAL